MRVHLRFSEKDIDLCRWRHSLKKNVLTHYIRQILLSEIRGEIAYLPAATRLSTNSDSCNIFMILKEKDIEDYLLSIPQYKRNSTIKRIIRKHLQAQSGRVAKNVFQEPLENHSKFMQSKPETKNETPKVEMYSKPRQVEPRKDV